MYPITLSVLDSAPLAAGQDPAVAIAASVELAQHVEALRFGRYWFTEHHNTGTFASAVPALLIAQVAAATSTIRVGSGGVMLPNHSPLSVAETFRTLEVLFPGRIDLGIGRAPGTDATTALALRRDPSVLKAEDFEERLEELLGFLHGFDPMHRFAQVTAIPRCSGSPTVHLLGSTSYSAELAARLGLAFAFANHINPGRSRRVLRVYHDEFEPAPRLRFPESILTVSVICGENDEHAEELAAPMDLMWLQRTDGFRDRMTPMPTLSQAAAHDWTTAEREQRRQNRVRHIVGGPSTVRSAIRTLADEARVDEVMILSMIPDLEARKRSYELIARGA